MHCHLNSLIQMIHTADAFVHWRKYLHGQLILIVLIMAVPAQLHHLLKGFLLWGYLSEHELSILIRLRNLSLPDTRSIDDNTAAFALTEYMLETDNRNLSPSNQILQRSPRPYRRKLIYIPDQYQGGPWLYGAYEMIKQWHINHRRFIYND